MALSWHITVSERPFGVSTWPARVSIPHPKGSDSPAGFAVTRPDGSIVPAQARALTRWPDGSPRWIQLDFQSNATGEYLVSEGMVDETQALPLAFDGNVVSVGRLQVEFNPAAISPLRRISWCNREIAVERICNFLVRDDEGKACPTSVAARNIKIESQGSLRLQLSWETEHLDPSGERLLDVRFRLEFLAGVEGFSLTYQFFHKLPGRELLQLQAIEGQFTFDGMVGEQGHCVIAQPSQGLLGMRRIARTRNTVPILVDSTRRVAHVKDLASIEDDCAYPYFLSSFNNNVSPVVALENDVAAVMIVLHDMEDLCPKTLTVQPGEIAFGIWPQCAGMLTLPQGRSAAQRFSFLFTNPGEEHLDGLLSASRAPYLQPAVGWLDPADSEYAGPSWDAARLFSGKEPGARIFASLFDDAFARYQLAGGMFDFGDSPHAGYTIGYVASGIGRFGDQTQRNLRFVAGLGGHDSAVMTSLTALQDLEPVWANNEYDAIYALALETLRTRSNKALNKLRAASRHQIEVDFVHYSDHWQHHRGTPCHTYDHTAASTAYPSHQWTQGLYYYYCLTGDDDVPEVIRAICDFNIAWLARPELQINHYFNRELGWALIAMVFGYELTGEETYREASRQLIKELEGFSGKEDFDDMYKACSTQIGSNESMLGKAFGVNTIPMGVRLYHQATGEDWAKDLLFRWVEIGFTGFNDRSTGQKICDMFPECFSYVCELTGDTRYLRESLWQLTMLLFGFNNIWAGNGPIDAKLYGRLYRGLMHFVSACARVGLLRQVESHFLGETITTGSDR